MHICTNRCTPYPFPLPAVLHYKELDAHPIWLPPIDGSATPLVSSPDGIELFATPPPDPMQGPLPAEVELRTREVRDRTIPAPAPAPAAKKAKITK